MTDPDTPPALDGALLLAIDLQPAVLRAIPGSAAIVRRCAFALEAAGLLGLPCAFTEQVPAKLGATAPELIAAAPSAPVFAKDTFSALAEPAFEEFLEQRGITHLLLAGIETPVCLYQTAIAALGRDLQVTLLSDCLGARRPDDAAAVLRYLAGQGAHVLPAEAVFYSILGSAAHPSFRAFTALVKRPSQS